LWNAIAMPDVSGARFYSKVFGQYAPTQKLLAERLPATALGAALAGFLS
jgi:hypothetical protein